MTATENGHRDRVRVDMTELTLREQRDINQILHDEHQCSFTEALQDWRQPDALALAVWKLRSRDDPTFTREQALDLSYADMDMIGPETLGEPTAHTGTALPSSPASGG